MEGAAELLFTENDTNKQRLWGVPNTSAYVKDAFHDYVTGHRHEAVNPARVGTKAAAHYRLHLIGAGESATICLRLTDAAPSPRSVRQAVRRDVRPAAHARPTSSTRASRPDGLRRRAAA